MLFHLFDTANVKAVLLPQYFSFFDFTHAVVSPLSIIRKTLIFLQSCHLRHLILGQFKIPDIIVFYDMLLIG